MFLSGDIDSLATLRANRLNYQPRHPATIRDGFVVYGLPVGGNTDNLTIGMPKPTVPKKN